MLHKVANKIWYEKKYYIISYLLIPFSIIWLLLVGIRWFYYKLTGVINSNSFVICVGNATVGGGGKTPTVIYLSKTLQALNYKVVVVKKAYKSKLQTAQNFKKNNLTMAEVAGDEACLINNYVDIIMCKSWKEGFSLLNKHNYQIVIMDDGMQNASIKKDFNLLVVDSKYNFGNKLVMPAGPLRNFLFFNLNKANAVLLLGKANIHLTQLLSKYVSINNIFSGQYLVKLPKYVENYNVLAFCALAVPNKFLDTLINNNFNVVKFITYPDHYLYNNKEINALLNLAKKDNLQLVCTSKDIVKIHNNYKKDILVIEQEIENTNLVNFIIASGKLL